MVAFLPRLLYIIAALSGILLVWVNPLTVFLAACFSCLTLPIFRKFRKKAEQWRKTIEHQPRDRRHSLLYRLSHHFPIAAYAIFLITAFFTPFLILALLVSPQAASGLARLRELQDAKLSIPPHWQEYLESLRTSIKHIPFLEKALDDLINNFNTFFTDAVGMLVSRSFGFVGSTLNLLWLVFLFLMLTILFTRYASLIRKVTARILQLPHSMLSRFILAIHRALKGIMLGVVLVALVQGILCGIGFAVAGVNQPAFWGLLATIVAPIPMVGTALVWGPLSISLWFGDNSMAAVGLVIWGAIFVAGVDNVLRPFFLRQGIKAPFFVLILVILCGLNSFGPVGLIGGPVLLAIAMQSIEEANRYYRR